MANKDSKFNKIIALEICDRLASGESLLKIVKSDNMPTRKTILSWRTKVDYKVNDITFGELYKIAREEQAEYYADLINDEALNAENAVIEASNNPDIDKRAISNLVQARRLKIDTLKWTASKLKPQQYGDKITHSGDQDTPITLNIVNYATRHSTNKKRVGSNTD
jgi:hypothetical protein